MGILTKPDTFIPHGVVGRVKPGGPTFLGWLAILFFLFLMIKGCSSAGG